MTKRSKVNLSLMQESVLSNILRGEDSLTISKNLGITKSMVNHKKRELRKLFQANSSIQLIVFASLEKKYYMQLLENCQTHSSDDLTEKEIEVAVSLLRGYINKEIADYSHSSIHAIKFHRDHFNQKCKVKNNRDFVIACIQNGILKLVPFEYKWYNLEESGRTIDCFYQSEDCYHIDEYSSIINPIGPIYFDFQNRFLTMDSIDGMIYNRLKLNPLVFSMVLSEIPKNVISVITELSVVFLESREPDYNALVEKLGGYLNFLQLLNEIDFLHIQNGGMELTDMFRLSRRLFLDNIILSATLSEKSNRTKFSERMIEQQEYLLRKEFNCDTDLTLIIQSVHFGIFSLTNIE